MSSALLGSIVVPLLVSPSVSGWGLRSAGAVLCGETTCQVYEFCSSEVDHQCRRCNSICDSKSRNYDENTCDQFCQDYIHDFVRHYIKKGELFELETQVDQLKSLVAISLLLGIILSILALLTVVFVWTRYRKLIRGNNVDDFYSKKMNLIKYISRNNNTGPSASIITPNSTLPQVITVSSTEPTNHNAPHALNSTHNGLSTLSSNRAASHSALDSSHNGFSPAPNARPDLGVNRPSSACRTRVGRCSTSPPLTGRHSVSPPSTSSTQLCGQLPRYPSEDATLEHAAYDNLAMTPTPPRTAVIVNERY